MKRQVMAVTTAAGALVLLTPLFSQGRDEGQIGTRATEIEASSTEAEQLPAASPTDLPGAQPAHHEGKDPDSQDPDEGTPHARPTAHAGDGEPGVIRVGAAVIRQVSAAPPTRAKSGRGQIRSPGQTRPGEQTSPREQTRRVERARLNSEAPLTRQERARPQFANSHEPASSEYGPIGELDSRQMLFEPGEPVARSEDSEDDEVGGPIEVYGVNGPTQVQGMTRQARTERIYGRLRRVMEMGRSPK